MYVLTNRLYARKRTYLYAMQYMCENPTLSVVLREFEIPTRHS